MNFPLCQIFSVLLMGICAPRVAAKAGYGRRFGSVTARKVLVEEREKTNWRGVLQSCAIPSISHVRCSRQGWGKAAGLRRLRPALQVVATFVAGCPSWIWARCSWMANPAWVALCWMGGPANDRRLGLAPKFDRSYFPKLRGGKRGEQWRGPRAWRCER